MLGDSGINEESILLHPLAIADVVDKKKVKNEVSK